MSRETPGDPLDRRLALRRRPARRSPPARPRARLQRLGHAAARRSARSPAARRAFASAARRRPQVLGAPDAPARGAPAARPPAPARLSSARQTRPSHDRLVDAARGTPAAARSGGRPGCRCPPWRRRPARARVRFVQVVPVVEVAAEAAHALQRAEGQLEPAGHLARA